MTATPRPPRYFFQLAYLGSHYRGWQWQKGVRSIQQTIEEVLASILKQPKMTIVGCGRTDAEVHASQFFFHTDWSGPLPDKLLFILNKRLPKDLSIQAIIPVEGHPHSRFDALERSYDYFIHLEKDAFLHQQSTLYLEQLDLAAMQQAVNLLTKYEDYQAFCKQPEQYNTTICQMQQAQLYQSPDGKRLRFHLTANRFLRGQIRILTQKLLEIGTQKFTVAAFEQALATQQRPSSIRPAPAQGLFLSYIRYPFLNQAPSLPAHAAHLPWQAL